MGREELEQFLSDDALFDPENMVWNKSLLIDECATLVANSLAKTANELVVERIWMEKIIANKVKNGHLMEGEIQWNALLKNPVSRTVKTISFGVSVLDGKLKPIKYFRDSTGFLIPFTKAAVANFVTFGIRSRGEG